MASAPAVNAGVHAGTGFEFQKHCALFIYLSKYNSHFEKQHYFLCLEHHDDFMFCFHDESGEINYISAYQAKKSSKPWGMGNNEIEIITKLLNTGEDLLTDIAPKTKTYSHRLQFVTNNTIKFSAKLPKPSEKIIQYLIDESTDDVAFSSLPDEISKKMMKMLLKSNPAAPTHQINNLAFVYLDIGRKAESQFDQLVGAFNSVFGESVADHKAAINALLLLFKRAELTFNKGNKATLLDEKKRIEYSEFEDTLKIITTKQKAYLSWRECGRQVCQKLKIPVSQKQSFETDIQNCFDLFKDTEMVDHRSILEFVKSNKKLFDLFYTDEDCIEKLHDELLAYRDYDLEEQQVKAALFAAYIEVRG